MRGLWRRLHLHRPARQPSGLFLVSQRDDVFQNGTPVNLMAAIVGNIVVYLSAAYTGWAMAAVIDHE